MTRLLPDIYDARFDEREVSAKDAVWREIVRYLQRYVDSDVRAYLAFRPAWWLIGKQTPCVGEPRS